MTGTETDAEPTIDRSIPEFTTQEYHAQWRELEKQFPTPSWDDVKLEWMWLHDAMASGTINQDGKTNGITAPSGPAQTALEVDTYQRFGIHPETISYVECHGTGTRLGDPIEIGALTDSFRRFTAKANFCGVGSVKSNIGHTLMASAAASVAKVVLL